MFHTIEQAKEQIATLEALERLNNNPDFQKVIIEGYCQGNSDVLVRLLSQSANERQYTERCNKLLAISYFREFMYALMAEGNEAKAKLNDPEFFKALQETETEVLNG